MRANLPLLVAKLAALRTDAGPIDVAMTTNGATLRSLADRLRSAGLRRVNISLDTLDRERFLAMTRRDELPRVLDGIDAACEAGFDPVKINAVVMRGVNDDEIVDLATFGRERGVEVRFIEWMPLDAGGGWDVRHVVGQDEIVARIDAVYPLEQVAARGAAPADRWRYLDGAGTVGVIPSVTKPFCGDCDRVRLTADGQFRTCLFATDESDLRAALRSGESDDEIAARDRDRRRRQVGGPPHQPGRLRPPGSIDVPDRRLSADLGGRAAVRDSRSLKVGRAARPCEGCAPSDRRRSRQQDRRDLVAGRDAVAVGDDRQGVGQRRRRELVAALGRRPGRRAGGRRRRSRRRRGPGGSCRLTPRRSLSASAAIVGRIGSACPIIRRRPGRANISKLTSELTGLPGRPNTGTPSTRLRRRTAWPA